MLILAIYLVIGLILGIISYGATFAYFQGNWPMLAKAHRDEDMGASGVVAFLITICPFAFIVIIFLSNFFKYGLKFK